MADLKEHLTLTLSSLTLSLTLAFTLIVGAGAPEQALDDSLEIEWGEPVPPALPTPPRPRCEHEIPTRAEGTTRRSGASERGSFTTASEPAMQGRESGASRNSFRTAVEPPTGMVVASLDEEAEDAEGGALLLDLAFLQAPYIYTCTGALPLDLAFLQAL